MSRTALRCPVLLVAVLTLSPPAPGAGPAGEAATECRALARERLVVRVNSGLYTERAAVSTPLLVPVDWGTDRGAYDDCMRIRALRPDASSGSYLVRLAECRSEAVGKPHVHLRGDQPRIFGGGSQAALRACLERPLARVEAELEPD